MRYLFVSVNKLIKNLKEVDWFSQNDLFVVIKYGNQERRTNVKWDNNKPEWNESFIFDEIENQKNLIFEIYDHNRWSPSQRLGQDIVDVNFKEPKIFVGKYLDVTVGNIWFKKEIKYDLLSLRNNKLKQENEQLSNKKTEYEKELSILKYKNMEQENKHKEITDTLNDLEKQYACLQKEYINTNTSTQTIYERNIKLENENEKILIESGHMQKRYETTVKENIALNEENIKLFEKISKINNIINKNSINNDNNP